MRNKKQKSLQKLESRILAYQKAKASQMASDKIKDSLNKPGSEKK